MNHTWSRVKTSLPNLNVLEMNGVKQGFIYKPKDSKTDKNAWRVYLGIGDAARSIGFSWSMPGAKRLLESLVIGNVRGLNS